jgi:hypothetical protein
MQLLITSMAASGQELFAGTIKQGVHRSTDNGNTWSWLGPESNVQIVSLAVHGPYLFAGTNDAAVWRRPLADPVSAKPNLSPAGDLRTSSGGFLRQGSEIHFSLQRRGEVHLGVYAARGQKIATLAQGVLNPGLHRAVLDFRGAEGVYFLRLQSDGKTSTQRIVFGK